MKIQQLDQLQSFTDVTSHVRNDLVFENRFKEYGAYQIRKNYAATLIWVLLFVFGGVSISILSTKYFSSHNSTQNIPYSMPDDGIMFIDKLVDVTPKIHLPIEKTEPPKTDVMKTEKFTANVTVVDDKDASQIKTQDVLKLSTVANTTQDGKIDEGNQLTETNIGAYVIDIGENKAFIGVQEMPTFAGGEEALFAYLQQNTTYPSVSKDLKIMGKVFVQFVVAPDGSIQKVIIARGVKGGKELEAEALRVVKNMPKWAPGKQNGVPVFVQLTLPVNFVLR